MAQMLFLSYRALLVILHLATIQFAFKTMFMLKGGENLVVFYMNASEGLKH